MLPLIIGVTGHRDLIPSEIPAIKASVRACLNNLTLEYPDLSITVLSPLAEGADQLVAEVAIELGHDVTALLPMPIVDYEADFNDSTLPHFRSLLTHCNIIELPLLPGRDRNQQYIELAGYLAAHSHILLALWDGEETHVPGGTSAVVHFHQHDTMSETEDTHPLAPIDFIEDESDLVFHVVCSRQSANPKEDVGNCAWLTRDSSMSGVPEMPERYRPVFERMQDYNRDQGNLGSIPPAQLLVGAEAPDRTRGTSDVFAIADAMAMHYQSRMTLALRCGYGFALIAGLSFIVYADLFPAQSILYTYLCAMILVLLVFRLESKLGWQRKYLDYRVLAEALRVQFYWQLAGVRMQRRYHFGHDSFHDRRDLQLGWIRNVMRHASLAGDARLNDAIDADVDATISSWIQDQHLGQASYYRFKADQRATKNLQAARLEGIGLALVLTAALVLILGPEDLSISDWLIALVGFVPFGIAVRQNFAHRVAEQELAAQYQYFRRIFSAADHMLQETSNTQTKRETLRALGEAALDESSQWILRQRERPVSNSGVIG